MTFRELFSRFQILSLTLLIVMGCWTHSAYSQSQSTSIGDAIPQIVESDGEPTDTSAGWRAFLESGSKALEREDLGALEFDALFKEAGEILDQTQARIAELAPQLKDLKQQLDELGPPPVEGEPAETKEFADRRASINQQFSDLDAQNKEAKLASIQARQLRQSILERRRSDFVRSIRVQSSQVFTPEFWATFFSSFDGIGRSVAISLTDSVKVASNELAKAPWRLAFLLFVIVAGLWAIFRFRRYAANWENRFLEQFTEFRDQRKIKGFFRMLRDGVAIAVIPVFVHFCLSRAGILVARIDQFLSQFVIVLALVIIGIAVIRSYLAPVQIENRILNVRNAAARQLFVLLMTLLLVTACLATLSFTSIALVFPFEISLGLSLISAVAFVVFAVAALFIAERDAMQLGADEQPGIRISALRILKLLYWLVAAAVTVAVFMGYIALAEFLSQQAIFVLILFAATHLVLAMIDYWQAYSSAPNQSASVAKPKLQAKVLGAGIAKLTTYMAMLVMLLIPWGYRTSDMVDTVRGAFFGFTVGGLTISVYTLFLATALFLVGYFITIGIRNWLQGRYFPTTNLDRGLTNSISTVVGYIGLLLAAILAITAAGFDLSNLAIVAGALSVGIGFGLQSVVGNFVSGLILLAERPIKAGDWVVTTGGEGTVKRISVRSTEIETFDRATIIVPNSTLISDPVTNWTHGTKMGRIILPIGVGYDSDPDQVRDILLECAKEHDLVLSHPAPIVYFMDFGASSLDFQLRCYLSDINNMIVVQSALRFSILRALREANIEIPFPQREISIKYDEDVPMLPQKKVASRTKRQGAAKKS